MNKTSHLHVLISDDHSIVRQGVALILKDYYENITIYQSSTFFETIEILKTHSINVLILDINFPDGNSYTIFKDIRKFSPNTKILILSAYEESLFAQRFFELGAHAYLNKLCAEVEILNTVKKIISDDFSPPVEIVDSQALLNASASKKSRTKTLSIRELEIALLLTKGYGNLEISNVLSIQKSTVSTYKMRIFDKLKVSNIPELIKKIEDKI
jgi:DNA-binding NarL/FixJ family response regulator